MRRFLKLTISPVDLKKPAVIILILANMIPIIGVLFLNWEVFPILLLFWTENVIIGVFNILKMAICSPFNPQHWIAKLFMIPFFIVHYGIFTLVHGILILELFGGAAIQETVVLNQSTIEGLTTSVWQVFLRDNLVWGFLSLLISHGISFGVNYIGQGEYKQASLSSLMKQPYKRVAIMHLTITIGGLLVAAIGQPVAGLILLVVLKIALDILAHLKIHVRKSPGVSESGSTVG